LAAELKARAHPFAAPPARWSKAFAPSSKKVTAASRQFDDGFAVFNRSGRGALEAIEGRYFAHSWRLEQAGSHAAAPQNAPKGE
jgi:hypothetical protein